MDRDDLKLIAHIDQTRSTVRAAIEGMDADDLIELFRDCAAGRLNGLDGPARQLAGMLAALAIYDLSESRGTQVEERCPQVQQKDACPNCGERKSDELVWLDDERVECQRCKTVYRPGGARHDRNDAAS